MAESVAARSTLHGRRSRVDRTTTAQRVEASPEATRPMSTLADRIRHARRSASLTQSVLAERVKVDRSAVAQWERKGGSRPTCENLAKLSVVTRVNFDWLATGRGRSRVPAHSPEEVPALELRFFARDDLEEQLLLEFRAMPHEKQIALVELLRSVTR
jgi:transcriptional regulator with XRE-family HTH domain